LVQILGLHVEEGLERLMAGRHVGVNEPKQYLLIASSSVDEVLNGKTSSLVDAARVIGEVVERRQDLVGQRAGDNNETTVHLLIVLGSTDVKASHNTEVVGPSLQSLPQISVLLLVGVDNASIGQNDLIVDDIVSDKSHLTREPPVYVSP
jgi:hypothetical protein